MALANGDGEVLLVFEVAEVVEDVRIRAANGKRYDNGCFLVARRGTMRVPRPGDHRTLAVNQHALGALLYYDDQGEPVIDEPGPPVPAPGPVPFPSRSHPFMANKVGKTLNQPERRLLRAYVDWIGDSGMFVHHPLKESGLFTDLFIPRRWTLVEAKVQLSRRHLREAIGQLFDYQRHYLRHPHLAVLLPDRPLRVMLDLFMSKKITVIWQTEAGSFRDSADGALTMQLRAEARRASAEK